MAANIIGSFLFISVSSRHICRVTCGIFLSAISCVWSRCHDLYVFVTIHVVIQCRHVFCIVPDGVYVIYVRICLHYYARVKFHANIYDNIKCVKVAHTAYGRLHVSPKTNCRIAALGQFQLVLAAPLQPNLCGEQFWCV